MFLHTKVGLSSWTSRYCIWKWEGVRLYFWRKNNDTKHYADLKHILKMKVHFENKSTSWKWKHILKIKAYFENESTFWKWKHILILFWLHCDGKAKRQSPLQMKKMQSSIVSNFLFFPLSLTINLLQ